MFAVGKAIANEILVRYHVIDIFGVVMMIVGILQFIALWHAWG